MGVISLVACASLGAFWLGCSRCSDESTATPPEPPARALSGDPAALESELGALREASKPSRPLKKCERPPLGDVDEKICAKARAALESLREIERTGAGPEAILTASTTLAHDATRAWEAIRKAAVQDMLLLAGDAAAPAKAAHENAHGHEAEGELPDIGPWAPLLRGYYDTAHSGLRRIEIHLRYASHPVRLTAATQLERFMTAHPRNTGGRRIARESAEREADPALATRLRALLRSRAAPVDR